MSMTKEETIKEAEGQIKASDLKGVTAWTMFDKKMSKEEMFCIGTKTQYVATTLAHAQQGVDRVSGLLASYKHHYCSLN